MANANRVIGQATYAITVPVNSGIKVEVGDAVFKNLTDGSAIPASGLSWTTDANYVTSINRSGFLGISMSEHGAGETASTIAVATEGYFRMPCSGTRTTALQLGDLWCLVKDPNGNYLANQLIGVSGSVTGSYFMGLETLSTGCNNNYGVKVRGHGITSRNIYV